MKKVLLQRHLHWRESRIYLICQIWLSALRKNNKAEKENAKYYRGSILIAFSGMSSEKLCKCEPGEVILRDIQALSATTTGRNQCS
jgi:hypothetical protein